jgi:hypothetical protein
MMERDDNCGDMMCPMCGIDGSAEAEMKRAQDGPIIIPDTTEFPEPTVDWYLDQLESVSPCGVQAIRGELYVLRELKAHDSPGINLRGIIADWLRTHGYDGLYDDDGECACRLNDLIPCGDANPTYCKPGVISICTCGEGHDSHIVSRERKAEDDIWLAERAEMNGFCDSCEDKATCGSGDLSSWKCGRV